MKLNPNLDPYIWIWRLVLSQESMYKMSTRNLKKKKKRQEGKMKEK